MPKKRSKKKKNEVSDGYKALAEVTLDGIFKFGKHVYDNIKEKPQEQKTESPPVPETPPTPEPLPSFIEEQNILHKRRLENEKIGKQFLKRLK